MLLDECVCVSDGLVPDADFMITQGWAKEANAEWIEKRKKDEREVLQSCECRESFGGHNGG